MTTVFPLRRSAWSTPFLVPLAGRRLRAEVDDQAGELRVRMGWIGRADIPLERIARVGTVRWPWWAGVGARIARGLVAFVGSSGTLVLVELSEPTRVRAPLGWNARSIAISAEDVPGLIDAIAEARRPPAWRSD